MPMPADSTARLPERPKLCFVGAGYVGLVSAAGFAAQSFDVVCADVDATRIEQLSRGQLPVYEPGLEEQLHGVAAAGRLTFTGDVTGAAAGADIVFITVGTPPMAGGQADISHVMAAARTIAPVLGSGTIVAVKSTVPVGTCRHIARLIRDVAPQTTARVVSVPEFLREGSAVGDFATPDRIVIGTHEERARAIMTRLYAGHAARGVPVIVLDENTAELVKYASNAFLAAKVSYINEMANLCSALGADIDGLAAALGADSRIGRSFLNPGPGYGGSCFPKDAAALAAIAREAGAPARIIESIIESNTNHVRTLAGRIVDSCRQSWARLDGGDGPSTGRTIAVLGLAFKANTDDVRWSASLVVVPQIMARGIVVQAYDPRARDNAAAQMPMVTYCGSLEEAVRGADAAVILTEWDEFRHLDWAALKAAMRAPVIFDARNLHDPAQARAHGFFYHSLGRA